MMKVAKVQAGRSKPEVKELPVVRTPLPSFQSIYVNNAQISATYFDIRMNLGEVVRASDSGVEVADKVQVTMSLEHAASLHKLLGNQIKKYVDRFGQLREEPTAP